MSGSSAYCTVCGSPLSGGARFCSRCGTEVGSPGTSGLPSGPPPLNWATAGYLGTSSSPHPRDLERTETGLLVAVIGFALLWIPYVSAVGAILEFVGLVMLWLGRRAFGRPHDNSVTAGGVLIVLAFLIVLVGSISLVYGVATAAAVSTLPGEGGVLTADLEAYFLLALVSGAMTACGYLFLPYALADGTSRLLLWGGMVGTIAIATFSYLYFWPQIASAIVAATSSSTLQTGPVTALEGRAALVGSVNVVPDLLFLLAYYRTRQRLIAGVYPGSPTGAPSRPYGRGA